MAKRRKRRPETSENSARKWAQVYYDLEPKKRKHLNVARKCKIPIPRKEGQQTVLANRIGRAIRRIEEKGFIRHQVLGEDTKYPPLLPELEDELREKYKLRDVVVVDVSWVASRYKVEKKEFELDDIVHELLGRWAARILVSQIRENDVIGIGSGRGVEYCKHFCQAHGIHKPRYVVSLTGSFPILGSWSKSQNRCILDSDKIIGELAAKLGAIPTISVGDRIATKLNNPRAKASLEENQRNTRLALIGLGAVGGHHRLLESPPEKIADELPEARDELLKLLEIIREAEETPAPLHGHWIGDISNHYFVACEHPNVIIHGRLSDAVKAVNDKFLSTDQDVFQDISKQGVVIAVAGGEHKATAIRYVLSAQQRGEAPWITHLVTDSIVAERILNETDDA
jgi:DNA-binding transcriptional regulator LsrR (DeoR family)